MLKVVLIQGMAGDVRCTLLTGVHGLNDVRRHSERFWNAYLLPVLMSKSMVVEGVVREV